jgi:hypothetical protein
MAARQNPAVLTSWKEIAAYLGKGVRTVQRWEREFGLPVRRPGGNSHVVHARCEDLQAWLAGWSQRQLPHAENPIPGNGSSRPGNGGLADLRVSVRAASELREMQRELVAELRKSVRAFTEKCQAMSLQIAGRDRSRQERPSPHVIQKD